jgi:hypothetical protein
MAFKVNILLYVIQPNPSYSRHGRDWLAGVA